MPRLPVVAPFAGLQTEALRREVQAAGAHQRLVAVDALTGLAAVDLLAILAGAGVARIGQAAVDLVGVDEQLPQAAQRRLQIRRQRLAGEQLLLVQAQQFGALRRVPGQLQRRRPGRRQQRWQQRQPGERAHPYSTFSSASAGFCSKAWACGSYMRE